MFLIVTWQKETNMKNILVVCFSQTGQLTQIIDSLTSVFKNNEFNIHYIDLKPKFSFPFPWKLKEFFRVFPEAVLKIPQPIDFTVNKKNNVDYDLVILGYQPWFLSPSIPITSFLSSDYAKIHLKNKKIVTVIGCRNMWIQAQEDVKNLFKKNDAKLVGNIVLSDKAYNFVSLYTILRWMLKGKKGKSGVSDSDIKNTTKYGDYIQKCLLTEQDIDQEELVQLGAVNIIPHLCMMEKRAKVIFIKFANLIHNEKRDNIKKYKTKLFQIYLVLTIIILSPISMIASKIMSTFFYKKHLKEIKYYQGVSQGKIIP